MAMAVALVLVMFSTTWTTLVRELTHRHSNIDILHAYMDYLCIQLQRTLVCPSYFLYQIPVIYDIYLQEEVYHEHFVH